MHDERTQTFPHATPLTIPQGRPHRPTAAGPTPDLEGRDLPRTKALVPTLLHLAVAPSAADVLVGISQDGAPVPTWTTVVADAEASFHPGGARLNAVLTVPDGTPDPAPVLARVLDTLLVGRGVDTTPEVSPQGAVTVDGSPLGWARGRALELAGRPAHLVEVHVDLTPLGAAPTPLALADTILSAVVAGLGRAATPTDHPLHRTSEGAHP